MISQETIQAVRDTARLAEIVGEVTALTPKGRNLVACCPFHNEKTPSFYVHDEEGYYHCFGCGESGNVISFLMKTRGLSFPDAIEYLADKYAIPIVRSQSQRQKDPGISKRQQYALQVLALNFFRQSLKESPQEVIRYCKERGLTRSDLNQFAIGYSPNSWSALRDQFIKRKVPEDALLESGLVRRAASGKLYDSFRGRLMFPILVEGKRVVAFGGRLIPGLTDEQDQESAPKYINSPESPIYRKSRTFFGLLQALNAIRESGEVYIVEGYLDVIAFHRVGLHQTVATCGTALTEEHLQRLKRLAKRVHLLFDGDAAGRKAAARVFEIARGVTVEIEVIFLPKDSDPDSFAVMHGAETLKMLKNQPRCSLLQSFVEFQVSELGAEKISDLGAASRGSLAEKIVSALSEVNNSVERDALLREAAHLLHTSVDSLSSLARGSSEPRKSGSRSPVIEKQTSPLSDEVDTVNSERISSFDALESAEKSLLFLAMARWESVPNQILSDPDIAGALDDTALEFLGALRDVVGSEHDSSSQRSQIVALLKEFGSSWQRAWKEAHALKQEKDFRLESLYSSAKAALLHRLTEDRIRQIEVEISQLDRGDEREAELYHALLELRRSLHRGKSETPPPK